MTPTLKQKILERVGFDDVAAEAAWEAMRLAAFEAGVFDEGGTAYVNPLELARWQSERDTALVTELLELVERMTENFNRIGDEIGHSERKDVPIIRKIGEQARADTEATLSRLAGSDHD
mgnify:CR=1 FL=1